MLRSIQLPPNSRFANLHTFILRWSDEVVGDVDAGRKRYLEATTLRDAHALATLCVAPLDVAAGAALYREQRERFCTANESSAHPTHKLVRTCRQDRRAGHRGRRAAAVRAFRCLSRPSAEGGSAKRKVRARCATGKIDKRRKKERRREERSDNVRG